MKKYICILATLIGCTFTVCSCKKNSGSSRQYYVKFNENGSTIEIDNAAEMFTSGFGSGYSYAINGYNTEMNPTPPMLNIVINNQSSLSPGITYTEAGYSGHASTMGYIKSQLDAYSTPATPPGTAPYLRITFTNITGDYVSGNFEGILYSQTVSPTPALLNITNGTFVAKRK